MRGEYEWRAGSVGAMVLANGNAYARGDENNRDSHGPMPGYAVVDFSARWSPSRDVELLEYMELLAVFEASSRRLLPSKYANITPEELDLRMRQLRAVVGNRR